MINLFSFSRVSYLGVEEELGIIWIQCCSDSSLLILFLLLQLIFRAIYHAKTINVNDFIKNIIILRFIISCLCQHYVDVTNKVIKSLLLFASILLSHFYFLFILIELFIPRICKHNKGYNVR